MLEKNLNHDLVSLFALNNAFAHKLPDPSKDIVLSSSKRPFDGFARFPPPVNDFWFESKLIKNKVHAFSLKRVEDHQFDALRQIKRNGGFTAIILGYWVPHKEYWFMLFDVDFLYNRREGSIKKNELVYYYNKGYSISLKNKDRVLFKPEMLVEKMINTSAEI